MVSKADGQLLESARLSAVLSDGCLVDVINLQEGCSNSVAISLRVKSSSEFSSEMILCGDFG
jgi:hypothetical protein